MSFTSIAISATGLQAAQRAMQAAAQDLANVNTPGHSRLRVNQVELRASQSVRGTRIDSIGYGTLAVNVERIRSEHGDLTVRTNEAWSAGADVAAGVAADIEAVLGPVNNSILDRLSEFSAAWERLGAHPTDLSLREEVLAASEKLTTALQGAAHGLDRIAESVDDRVYSVSARINTLATQLAALNVHISSSTAQGSSPNELMDQRDVLLDELSRLTAVRIERGEGHMTNVYVGNIPLVRAGETTTIDVSVASGRPSPVWAGDGHAVDLGGELGALVEARAYTLEQTASELDQLAVAVRDAANETHAQGYDLSGRAGRPFFVGEGAGDLAVAEGIVASTLAASDSPDVPNGATALAMADASGRSVGEDGLSIERRFADFVSRIGATTGAAADRAHIARLAADAAQAARTDLSAVNIDEELSDLVRFQRAYEASARVMTVADEMLSKLINGTGRAGL